MSGIRSSRSSARLPQERVAHRNERNVVVGRHSEVDFLGFVCTNARTGASPKRSALQRPASTGTKSEVLGRTRPSQGG